MHIVSKIGAISRSRFWISSISFPSTKYFTSSILPPSSLIPAPFPDPSTQLRVAWLLDPRTLALLPSARNLLPHSLDRAIHRRRRTKKAEQLGHHSGIAPNTGSKTRMKSAEDIPLLPGIRGGYLPETKPMFRRCKTAAKSLKIPSWSSSLMPILTRHDFVIC